MNFTFSLASDVFAVHPGVKFKGSLDHLNARKIIEKVNQTYIVDLFSSELTKVYPGREYQCYAFCQVRRECQASNRNFLPFYVNFSES